MSQEVKINNEIAQSQITKPDATVQLILACVNILLCGSVILGIIALVFAVTASSEKDYNEANNKLKIAKILNICGISFSVLVIILFVFVYLMIVFGMFSISFLSGIL